MKNIIQTSFILIITLIIIPTVTYFFDNGLSDTQWKALKYCLWVCSFSVMFCFILGELTGNNSQVDKLWSILPIIYSWQIAIIGGVSGSLILASTAVSIWGIRLTYNFSRRGAYKIRFWEGEEDYRWKVLREMSVFQPNWKWKLFNLFFICAYQNALIFLFTTPMIKLIGNETIAVKPITILFYVLILFFIYIEWLADQQQWDFQKAKQALINANEKLYPPFDKGFISIGLWKYSRHPNYTAEQMIWILFYLMCAFTSNEWINWTSTGALLLIILFQGSANFSESISSSKYPEYNLYQKNTGRFIPKIFK
jgi:steroid 5-alpha reductase family enzyme